MTKDMYHWVMGPSSRHLRLLSLICEIHSPCKRHLTQFTVKETGIWFSHPDDLVFKCCSLETSSLSHPTITRIHTHTHTIYYTCDTWAQPSLSQPTFSPALTHSLLLLPHYSSAWESGKLKGSGQRRQDKQSEVCLYSCVYMCGVSLPAEVQVYYCLPLGLFVEQEPHDQVIRTDGFPSCKSWLAWHVFLNKGAMVRLFLELATNSNMAHQMDNQRQA